MRKADEKEILFKLKFGLQQLPRSVLRDLNGSAVKREAALGMAADIIWEQLSKYRFEADDPVEPH